MQAGDLQRRYWLQAKQTVVNPDTGSRREIWANVDTQPLPAKDEGLSGKEFLAAAATQSKVTGRIKIRWRPDITSDHRLLCAETSRVLNIEAVLLDNKSGRDWLTLLYSQGVNDG